MSIDPLDPLCFEFNICMYLHVYDAFGIVCQKKIDRQKGLIEKLHDAHLPSATQQFIVLVSGVSSRRTWPELHVAHGPQYCRSCFFQTWTPIRH